MDNTETLANWAQKTQDEKKIKTNKKRNTEN